MQHWTKHHTRIGVLIRVVILGLFIFLLIYELPAYPYKRKDSKPEHQQVIRAAARPRTVSEERGMSMGLEQQLEMREEHKKKMRSRQQGNRLGIFLVMLGLGLVLFGCLNVSYPEPTWITATNMVGGALLVFGYPLAPGSERRSTALGREA